MYYLLNAGSDTDLTAKSKTLRSWHISAAAGAVVNFKNGGTGGDIVFQVQLAGASSAGEIMGHKGMIFPAGLYVDWVSGAVTGSVDLD